MKKLICDFSSFETKKNELKTLVDDYNSLLNSVINNDINNLFLWNGKSKNAYFEKFYEKKEVLNKLSSDYALMISLLEEVDEKYKAVESKYAVGEIYE